MNIPTFKVAAVLLMATAASGAEFSAAADNGLDSRVRALVVERTQNKLLVSMQLDFSDLKLKSDREITYIPVLSFGDSVCELPQLTVAGRSRYIQHQRHDSKAELERVFRPGKLMEYSEIIPYKKWMETATLSLVEDECKCGINSISNNRSDLAVLDFRERIFAPAYAFITPQVEKQKSREVQGSAYIDFPVNRAEIRADYRRNPAELQKIRNTIDVLRNDDDINIVAVSFQGFASPEGKYSLNENLARKRTESLARYVGELYTFPASIIKSSWTAEDWDGLRKYVESSDMENRDAILDIINMAGLDPDKRELKIKKSYPAQYKYLLENVYPGLRHSDYAVKYVVRSYADVDEIAKVLKTAPQKLSLHEMYILAQSLDPASDDYKEVFEVAVRMFPDDPVANLNAANIALRRNELNAAEAYLVKAQNSPEKTYAYGVLAAKRGQYDNAMQLLNQALSEGCSQAQDAINQLEEVKRYAEGKQRLTK